MKSKQLFPYATDFVIILIILALTLSSFFAVKSILYSGRGSALRITVITESLPNDLEGSIKAGDTVYDNLTKKRLGEIDSIYLIRSEETVRYEISFISSFEPRGDSLRTKSVWFRFSEVEV
jgi:hypothetical protein